MVRGLKLLEPKLTALNIPFFLLRGAAEDTLPALAQRCEARLVVMDYSPLRPERDRKRAVTERLKCGCVEVDAHNVVPVWIASSKREYAARTLRPKIQSRLDAFLTDYPSLTPLDADQWPETLSPEPKDWSSVLESVLRRGAAVPEVSWIASGEDAGDAALKAFLRSTRLKSYAQRRNDPTVGDGQSGLSPFLHFGFLSAQRVAYEALKYRHTHKESVEAFLEELVVRRELSDNFCHYTSNYDALDAAPDWAKATLEAHLHDPRPYLYTPDQFEKAETHEDLWNACQKELLFTGKLHGYLRMYWAKKILEWSSTPAEALQTAIHLNDKYSLDGRDPNGYVGCQWSIAGIHDRAFREVAVTGKIRSMTYAGCKRKFDIEAYLRRVEQLRRDA